MLAFHGKQEIKDKYLARVRAHKLADEIVHGRYWKDGKGCAVGCTIHSGNHSSYESELGIPRILAKLEDGIFEALCNGRAKEWPEQFLMAPEVGADLSLIWPQFSAWMLADEKYGVIRFAKKVASRKAILDVADAYRMWAESGIKPEIDWSLLSRAAYAAAADAAYAADAAAAAAAAAAAYAAVAADADDAAAAVYVAVAVAAARQEWRNAQADKLIELMQNAPVLAV